MANEQNLIPNSQRSPQEVRENGRKGGIKSGQVRRQKKTLAQIGDMIGSLGIVSEESKQLMRQAGIKDDDLINDTGMMFQLNLKAQQGDTKAAELLAKLRGQFKEQIAAEVAEVKPLVDLTKRKKNGE